MYHTNVCALCNVGFYSQQAANQHFSSVHPRDNSEATVASVEIPDKVNHPSHYTKGGIETIDYMKAKLTKEQFTGYLLGNVIKYTSRFQDKNGLEDLKKAEVYLKRLINQYDNDK